MKFHGLSQWVDAQGDLKFIQNPIMREVQKFGEHEQASSHLFFATYSNERKFGKNGTIRHPYCNTSDLDITAVWFLIFVPSARRAQGTMLSCIRVRP